MLSIRIQSMLSGYKRGSSNTELFIQDLNKINKFISVLHERKDFYKVRNKLCELTEVFDIEVIDQFISDYFSDVLDDDSLDMYYLAYNELLAIKRKAKLEESKSNTHKRRFDG